jgi:hypothetical protein
MLIRGKWEYHPGNYLMDGEGFDHQSPIVMNVFDYEPWENDRQKLVDNFMIFIRVMQFLVLRRNGNETIQCIEIENRLIDFFHPEFVKIALQKLLFAGILYSPTLGVRNIDNIGSYKAIIIENETEISLVNSTIDFYLIRLICEFEYLYSISFTSNIPRLFECQYYEKEKTVLNFLKGIYEVIKVNILDYERRGVLENFYLTFHPPGNSQVSRPFRRMLDTYVTVLEQKIKFSSNKNITDSFVRISKLLDETIQLQSEATAWFDEHRK